MWPKEHRDYKAPHVASRTPQGAPAVPLRALSCAERSARAPSAPILAPGMLSTRRPGRPQAGVPHARPPFRARSWYPPVPSTLQNSSGGPRAAWTIGASVGNPRHVRIARATAPSVRGVQGPTICKRSAAIRASISVASAVAMRCSGRDGERPNGHAPPFGRQSRPKQAASARDRTPPGCLIPQAVVPFVALLGRGTSGGREASRNQARNRVGCGPETRWTPTVRRSASRCAVIVIRAV